MIEDGMRFQVDISGKDFTIVEQLSSKMIVYANGVYLLDALEHIKVVEHLNSLASRLIQSRVVHRLRRIKDATVKGVEIIDLQHCKTQLTTTKGTATLDENKLYKSMGFEKECVLDAIASVIETLCRSGSTIIDPKKSVVRELVDMKLVVFKDVTNGNIIAVHKDNIYNNTLSNVMFNRELLDFLYVDIHKDEGVVYMFDKSFREVCELPYDESFSIYFVPDDNVFESEG